MSSKQDGGILSGIASVLGFSTAVLGVAVGVPVAISTGNGGKAVAATFVMLIIWFLIRAVFGEKEADAYVAKVGKKSEQDE